MNPKVDVYFTDGCGRCSLGGTPDCKVHNWDKELEKLRMIVLDCGLTEERKWGMPCYTFEGSNVILIGAFKTNCVLSFFNGVLLKDPHDLLEKAGENTRVGRQIRFTHVQQILEIETILKAYINEAIEIQKSGLKPETNDNLHYPEELQQQLDNDATFKTAFEALTPGRQRGYVLYFSGAKQSKTRTARIEKYRSKILDGKGFHDR